jgi:hypothetical protein
MHGGAQAVIWQDGEGADGGTTGDDNVTGCRLGAGGVGVVSRLLAPLGQPQRPAMLKRTVALLFPMANTSGTHEVAARR